MAIGNAFRVLVGVVFSASPLAAQDGESGGGLQSSVFLAPDRFGAAPGVGLDVGLLRGDFERAAEEIGWAETSWLFVRGGGRQWNVSAMPAGEATDGLTNIEVPMPDNGAAMIGADFEPVVETWTGEALRAFFAARGGASFDPSVFDGRDDVRVSRRRSAVAIVRAQDAAMAGMPSPAAMTKAGLISEIRLDHDPTVLEVGDSLRVRLYAGYRSRKGVAVLARGGEGAAHMVPVDGFGRCDIPIDAEGVWRLEFHYAELTSAHAGEVLGSSEQVEPESEVTLYTATVTFEIGGDS